MKTTIKGIVINVTKKTGTSPKGEWNNTTVVVQTEAQYRNVVPVSFFNKDVSVAEGDKVEVDLYVGGREYQGKYYADLDGDAVRVITTSSSMPANDMPPLATTPKEEDFEDLPF